MSKVSRSDRLNERRRVQISFEDSPSLTHQSFKDECDIRNIMNKYKRTGLVSHMTSAVAQYGDFSNVPDYQEALNVVIAAQDSFDSLPAEVRKRFDNDPGAFLEFVGNPDNREEMISLGMIVPVEEQSNSLNSEPLGEATQ